VRYAGGGAEVLNAAASSVATGDQNWLGWALSNLIQLKMSPLVARGLGEMAFKGLFQLKLL